ncbi:MAG: hypothetical protein FJ109_21645 [Deltaproteobacteria bacterium]|nr:hypothetical protein [Deltaproteobacteria bacterium]
MRIRPCRVLAALAAGILSACTAGAGSRLPSERVGPMLFKAEQLLDQGETCSGLLILVEVRETADEPADRAQAATRLLEANQGDDTLPLLAACAVRSRVLAMMDTARSGVSDVVTLRVRSTVGWGCPCPPFVFAASGDTAIFEEEMLYPVFTDPADYDRVWEDRGIYRLTGRMNSMPLDFYNWSKLTGKPQEFGGGDGEEYRLKRHPVFEVESWCFRPDPGVAEGAAEGGSSLDAAHRCPQD